MCSAGTAELATAEHVFNTFTLTYMHACIYAYMCTCEHTPSPSHAHTRTQFSLTHTYTVPLSLPQSQTHTYTKRTPDDTDELQATPTIHPATAAL